MAGLSAVLTREDGDIVMDYAAKYFTNKEHKILAVIAQLVNEYGTSLAPEYDTKEIRLMVRKAKKCENFMEWVADQYPNKMINPDTIEAIYTKAAKETK